MTTETVTGGTNGEPTIHQTQDDGGSARVGLDELAKFKAEIDALTSDSCREVAWRRQWADDIRFCRWEGQSPDGLKHADDMDGEPPFPFEGARDTRVRSADAVCTEHVLVLTHAALGAAAQVKPMEIKDAGWSDRMNTLLRWVLFNQLGARYLREIWRLCQYQEGDSPGGGVLGVWWRREMGLRSEKLTLESFIEKYILATSEFNVERSTLNVQRSSQQNGDGAPSEEEILAVKQAVIAALADPEGEEFVVQMVEQACPGMKKSRSRKVARELRASFKESEGEKATSSYPIEYQRINCPDVCAYRLYQDIFFPMNTTDPERCRAWFLREWLTEVELIERKTSHGYTESFVTAVKSHMGKTGFALYEPNVLTRDGVGNLQFITQQGDAHRGEYEVVTAIYRAVNEDEVPGIYLLPFSKFVDEVACDRELLEYAHGKYPLIWFSREILTSRLVDSRGVPEMDQTDQQVEKFVFDLFSDNASLAGLPPIEVPRSRGKLQLTIGPLKQIKVDRPGQVRFMEGPQFPAVADKLLMLLRERRNEYWGRPGATTPPQLVQLHQQGMVNLFLASLKEVLKQLLQLCQQHLTDDELSRITGANGMAVARSVEEIQGQFDIDLSFSTIGLDFEMLIKLAEVIGRFILPMDTLNTVQRDQLVRWLFNAINPNLAESVWRPSEEAGANEQKDEAINFARIMAGDEPPMMSEGQNFGLRLQTLNEILQKNPEIPKKLSPISKQILEARMEHLGNQVEQQKNAMIGRRVGDTALGG